MVSKGKNLPMRKSDAYRKDSSPRGLNHRDKGSPAKKVSTAMRKAHDNQC